jgi:two-component system, OmpR family, response regulator
MVEYRQSPTGLKHSMVYRKPLNVGLVAKICQVSKKTVLNWIYRDALKAFTTYGGHYRVWPGDLKEFITRSGLDVPFNYIDERQTTFLIVDDDSIFANFLKEAIYLEYPESNIIITDDGYEALFLLGEKKPNVVFLDLRMPKIDGYQVLELLRNRKKDAQLKIVVLSGYIDEEARQRLSGSVADQVWEKGKNLLDLRHSLKGLLNGSASKKDFNRSVTAVV